MAETYTAHHHKDKAATLHVVPEYEDTDDVPTPGSGNDSNSTLPIPRARQAFIPRGSSDGDPPMSVAGQPTHLQLPSPTASSQQLYGSLSKWGGTVLAELCTSDLVAPVACVQAESQQLAPRSMHACIVPLHLVLSHQMMKRILMAQYLTMAEGVQKPCGRGCRKPSP